MTKWALITGASEGLGREFADLAAQEGFGVILTARQADKLTLLAKELEAKYAVATVVLPADLSDPAAVEQLWHDASDGRTISVLVNNAGLGRNGDFSDAANWPREKASVSVNVVAATILFKHAIGHMREKGAGKVLNVASVAGFIPGPNMAVYHATKAYFLHLSEAVAEELRGSGVTVTALCPGATQTAFFTADDAEQSTLLTRVPLPTAQNVARKGWAAMNAGKRVYVPGILNKISAFLLRTGPRALNTKITGMMLKKRW